MGFVYILLTRNRTKYIGSTIDLKRRLAEHHDGKVFSTRSKRPIILFAYRKFKDIKDAALWEKKYKRSHGQMERDLKNGILVKP